MSPPSLRLLEPAVRGYAWGSRRFLADLQGRPAPTPTPEAEAWFGAHPGAPARTVASSGADRLDEVIDADPAGELGVAVLERFGPRLPFLTKLLAADAPLSLQAHPSAEQARRGFEVEEALGIARDAPDRNYRDAWPKPELLLALTPFRALCGFREPIETADFLAALDVRGLDVVVERLARDGPGALADVVAWALRDGRDAAIATLPELRSAAARVREGAWASTARCVVDLADRYPGDPGTVVALLLRLVELAPGQAIHVPDGVLHAYLGGAGLEVMASSDNVLRGGLTAKHVDVDALLEVVDPRPLPPPFVSGERQGDETVYATPTPHFRLSELTVEGQPVRLDDRGPQVLVAVGGATEVTVDGAVATITSGRGAFVSARATEVTVSGHGRLLRTTTGDPV
ncbi:mannose-6-phosphate isomerase, class I [Nitriliruptor alkaliphilus]|uniref:mannose-6-phosphate isomerase, class I n=1 Tax=Nitriliruptor alkaliphilus TaxID=427918 RepID=UPI00069673A9|nr:mannose-6-phosphate isomerase, class I [Nitriliruptor alkaliphilus]